MQTDDLGKTYGTPAMTGQAALDNERRWLSFDLLCGRVDRAHPLWEHIRRAGIPERDLLWFQENPCPPDVLGINYYVTSERFLDDRVERYPDRTPTVSPWPEADAGRVFADVEAVRVYEPGLAGPAVLLREAWERYHLPLAVTEVQLACTREEQMRWLLEIWESAQSLNRQGVDVQAVTCWALFGAFDWASLVRHAWGDYEPGAFDLRAPEPRPTALAAMMRELAAGRVPDHPVLAVPGWWRRPDRFEYPPDPGVGTPQPGASETPARRGGAAAPVMIVGAESRLGAVCARLCDERGLPCCTPGAVELDVTDPASVEGALRQHMPWAVVNALDMEWGGPSAADGGGGHGPVMQSSVLAAACAQEQIPLLMFSSDAVFDGAQERPYTEDDPVSPGTDRGLIQAAAEACVQEACPEALIMRTGACFDPWSEQDWVARALTTLAAGQAVTADNTVVVSPVSLVDLVNASLDLLLDGERGVWHLSNHGAMTEEEFVCLAAAEAGLDPAAVTSRVPSVPALSVRGNRALGTVRGTPLRPLPQALAEYFRTGPLRHHLRAPLQSFS